MTDPAGSSRAATVYLAGPLGFTAAGLQWQRAVLMPAMAARGAEVLDPWADQGAGEPAPEPGPDTDELTRLAGMNEQIGARNVALIHRAGAVFAVLDGSDVDSGTAAEIGYAAALGLPVVGWRGDTRLTGDNAATVVNLQVEHFIRLHGGSIHRDLTAALDALGGLLQRPVGGPDQPSAAMSVNRE